MAEIIENAHVSTERFQERSFLRRDDPNSGFAFAVKDGEVDFSVMSEGAEENFKYCVEHPEIFIDEGIITREYDVPIPAQLRCDCGETFYLENDYYGAYQCPNCGQWYNWVGQHLKPPEEWEEPLEDD